MKKFTLFLFAALSLSLAEAQWLQQSTPTNVPLRHLYFLDEQFGFSVGVDGTIIKTVDGGVNWQLINSGVDDHLNAVHMTSYQTGYIVGNDGVLLKTANGGNNWMQMNSNNSGIIKDVYFLDDFVGFYCGQGHIIAKTMDGGFSWDLQNFGDYWLRGLDFPTNDIGFCVGDGGHIHKTIDGGESWFQQNSGTTDHLIMVDFPSSDTGFVSGINGRILKTTDGGINWQTVNAGTNDYLSGLSFISISTGYVTGFENILYKTTDSGLSWEPENLNCADTAVRLLMLSEETGYICGKNGLMLRKCQLPFSDFSFEINGLSVNFTNLSSDFSSCSWDFGDGYYSDVINPSHVYNVPGTYNVCLISTNECGIDTICQTIELIQTGIHDQLLPNISVYPIPNNGRFNISCSQPHLISEIIVRNSAGIIVARLNWNPSSEELDVNLDQLPGIYFLDFLLDNTRSLKKIIITE